MSCSRHARSLNACEKMMGRFPLWDIPLSSTIAPSRGTRFLSTEYQPIFVHKYGGTSGLPAWLPSPAALLGSNRRTSLRGDETVESIATTGRPWRIFASIAISIVALVMQPASRGTIGPDLCHLVIQTCQNTCP